MTLYSLLKRLVILHYVLKRSVCDDRSWSQWQAFNACIFNCKCKLWRRAGILLNQSPRWPSYFYSAKVKVGDEILVSKTDRHTGSWWFKPRQKLIPAFFGYWPCTISFCDSWSRNLWTFWKIIVVHGTRFISELAYQDLILNEIPNHEFFGELGAKEN